MYAKNFTTEERQKAIALAHLRKKEIAAFNEANKHLYKTEYLDSGYWQDLASKHKVRMPSSIEPISLKGMRKAIRKCKLEFAQVNEHYTSLNYFIKNNPTWTNYGFTGLMLELKSNNLE